MRRATLGKGGKFTPLQATVTHLFAHWDAAGFTDTESDLLVQQDPNLVPATSEGIEMPLIL